MFVLRLPRIQVCLKCLQGPGDFLPECHAVELIQQRLVGPLTDPVGLRMADLGAGVINVLPREV